METPIRPTPEEPFASYEGGVCAQFWRTQGSMGPEGEMYAAV
jgi:hypothetical protein